MSGRRVGAWRRALGTGRWALGAGLVLGAAALAAQQRPVFRGGTNFVQVDVYPRRDGQVVAGLNAEDFEILEDGKPQRVELVEFIPFALHTPDAATVRLIACGQASRVLLGAPEVRSGL